MVPWRWAYHLDNGTIFHILHKNNNKNKKKNI